MEMLSLPATQEHLVSKMAFSAPHLVPFFKFLTPTTYSKQAVEMRRAGNCSCFIHVALHPAFIT